MKVKKKATKFCKAIILKLKNNLKKRKEKIYIDLFSKYYKVLAMLSVHVLGVWTEVLKSRLTISMNY